jgi:RNA polymerase sigma-70 factor (ECF subfamily)
MDTVASSNDSARVFPHTRWSVVLAATQPGSPESARALEALCHAYWHPLYAYARRCGQSPHDAQDLTQSFFQRLLEKQWLADADREKGRLRTFLVLALKHFMANEWRRTSAQKRGGHHFLVPLDTELAEKQCATDSQLSPDEVFDRQWSLVLLDLTLNKLQSEFAATGRSSDYAKLKNCLMAEHGAIDYAAIAQDLGLNAGAARVAVHRLRKRFRQLFREEISRTLADRSDLEGELRHLAAALACEGK